MRNRLVTLISASTVVLAGVANAQAPTPAPATQVVGGATAADLIAFFQAADIRAADITDSADAKSSSQSRTVEVSMGEGSTFYVGLLGCENATPAARCEFVMPYVIFGSLNFPLARVNAFNFSSSAVSTMMLSDEGAIMMSARFNMAGGVTRKNLFINIATFVSDIGEAVDAIQKGGTSGSTISYTPDTDRLAGFGLEVSESTKVNWIGKATKTMDRGAVARLRHLGAAQ